MSAPLYKVGNLIKVIYQADRASTGRTILMDVFDETLTLTSTADQTSSAMSEIAGRGRYRDTFTPDSTGDWIVLMQDSVNARGKVVAHYEVSSQDLDSIGNAIDDIGNAAMVG